MCVFPAVHSSRSKTIGSIDSVAMRSSGTTQDITSVEYGLRAPAYYVCIPGIAGVIETARRIGTLVILMTTAGTTSLLLC